MRGSSWDKLGAGDDRARRQRSFLTSWTISRWRNARQAHVMEESTGRRSGETSNRVNTMEWWHDEDDGAARPSIFFVVDGDVADTGQKYQGRGA